MSTFVITANWTDQGVRAIKDVPKRTKAARDLAKKLGVEIKHAFLTTGESDLLLIGVTGSGLMLRTTRFTAVAGPWTTWTSRPQPSLPAVRHAIVTRS
jgi:uncharacterized protein with GYD domain